MQKPTKLTELALERVKSPTFWGKASAVITTLILIVQFYYDVREDLRNAREGIEDTQEEIVEAETDLKETGQASEKSMAKAIVDLQKALQFVYDEGSLLVERVDKLEKTLKQMQKRLDKYRELTGIPPEELDDESLSDQELRDLAAKLLPFLEPKPKPVATSPFTPHAVLVESMGEEPPTLVFEEDVLKQKQDKMREQLVGKGNQIKFESPESKWATP